MINKFQILNVWNLTLGSWGLFVICILFFGSLLFAIPQTVYAGIILQSPKYIGLSNGLVGHWTFDGNSMAGTRAHDLSGNGNDRTLTNGPVRAARKMRQALDFDGVNDILSI